MNPTTQTYRTRVTTVEAVQWTGENLVEVQQFVAPASPLLTSREDRQLGLHVRDTDAEVKWPSLGKQTKLAFVSVGGWVVRQVGGDGRLDLMTDETFARAFVPANEVLDLGSVWRAGTAAANETSPFTQGGSLAATHPRAIETREPVA